MTRHATFDEIRDASEQMSLGELSKLCNDLAIVPSLLTMEDLRYHVFQDSSSAWKTQSDVYMSCQEANGGGGADGNTTADARPSPQITSFTYSFAVATGVAHAGRAPLRQDR